MRLPLQGGLPPDGALSGDVVEIACDESGFSGTNLLDPSTPVITHASVDLTVDEAVELIAGLRSTFRSAPYEFKSGPFLRSPRAAEALLAELAGRAHVHVLDKEFFLTTRVVDLFLGEPSWVAGTRLASAHRPAAEALYDHRGDVGWRAFLAAFVELVRTKRRHRPDEEAVTRFFRARDALGDIGITDATVRTVLARLFEDDGTIPPPLEPMIPALAETVLFWSAGVRTVLVIHDEQSALTAGRLRSLQRALPGAALAGLIMADSRDDPRVQVADLLAGMARRLPDARAALA